MIGESELVTELVALIMGVLDGTAETFARMCPDDDTPIEDLHREWTYLMLFSLDAGLHRMVKDSDRRKILQDACLTTLEGVISEKAPFDHDVEVSRMEEYGAVLNSNAEPHFQLGLVAATHCKAPKNLTLILASGSLFHSVQECVHERLSSA